MKKLISVLLIISMLLSFTSCGTQTIVNGSLTLKIKGNESKKLKMSLSDRLDAYSERNFVVSENEDMKISVSEKTKNKTVTYTVKGSGAGSISAYIEYVNEGSVVGLVSFLLTVNAKGKVVCSNFSFGTNEKYSSQTSSDQEYQISEFEGETRSIRLPNGNGTWVVGTCDNIVSVVGTETSDQYTEVTMTAEKEGEGCIQIYNRKEGIQYYFDLKVTMQENGRYLLDVTGAQKIEFNHQDDKELIEKQEEAKEEIKEIIDEKDIENIDDIIIIPDWAYVASLFKYNNKRDVEKKTVNDGTPDTVDATIESSNALYDYNVSKDIDFNEKLNEFRGLDVGIKEETLKINDYEITYIFVETGFAVAIWKYGNYVSVLTVMEPNTEAECKQAVLDFFS